MYLLYLDYFRSVAKYESMTKAAEHLHISQPALSQTIIKLEDELGVQLFQRSRGKLTLTTAGKLYYDCVDRALADIEKGTQQMLSFQARPRESVTVVSSFPHLLSDIVNDYSELGSGLTINPYIYSLEEAVRKLTLHEASYGILPFCRPKRFDMNGEILRQHKVYEEEVLLLVGRIHPFSTIKEISIADLRRENFVLNEQNFDKESFLEYFCDSDYLPDILISGNETRMLNPLVAAGKAVYLTPVSDLIRDMAEGSYAKEMTALRISERPMRAIFLSKLEDHHLSELSEDLYSFIQDFFVKQDRIVSEWMRDRFG